ncbi:8700_t:CDS:2, partial [Racocetra persica]
NENELERSELGKSELEVIKLDISKVNDINILIDDLLVDNSSKVQQLIQDIEKYSYLINQPVITKDILTDKITVTEAVEMLKKIIRYQKDLEAEKGSNKNRLKMLRKNLKEWNYKKEK